MSMNIRLCLLSIGLFFAVSPALSQLKAGEKPTAEQVASGEALAVPVSEAETVYRGLQGSMVARQWSRLAALDLLDYIMRSNQEGLEPADYAPDVLRAALQGNDDAALDRAATDSFLKLSADLALGNVPMDARDDWHMKDTDLDGAQQFALMERAIQAHEVREVLDSLLPTHFQYAELKAVLASATDAATIGAARVNLERWRWLPRELGSRYVIVNVPAFTVALVENGHVVTRHRAIVGAVKTPTPQLSAIATGVIFNPWWEVPSSIANEVKGKSGYVSVPNGDNGVRYRQPPGPGNSLGRVKVVMPNNYAIYLHDTPAKTLFTRDVRAFSHGCIRTQDALGFARMLLNSEEWDEARINQVVASGKTVQAEAAVATPVYITYFTAAAAKNGAGIITYKDVYGRDANVVAALNSGKTDATMASAKQ